MPASLSRSSAAIVVAIAGVILLQLKAVAANENISTTANNGDAGSGAGSTTAGTNGGGSTAANGGAAANNGVSSTTSIGGGGGTSANGGAAANAGVSSTGDASGAGGSASGGGSTTPGAGGNAAGGGSTTPVAGGNAAGGGSTTPPGVTTTIAAGATTSAAAAPITTIVKTRMAVTVETLQDAQVMAADPVVEDAFEAVMANVTNVPVANVEASLTATSARLLMEQAEAAARRLAAKLVAAFEITVPDGTPTSTITNAIVATINSTDTLQSALVQQLIIANANYSTINITVSSLSVPVTIVIQPTTPSGVSSNSSGGGVTVPSGGGGAGGGGGASGGGAGGGGAGGTTKPGTISAAAMAKIGPLFCAFFLWLAAW